MNGNRQMTFADASPEYEAFVAKFKPKKTTDDCYTPKPVYNAVRDYVARRWGLDPASFVRPFWPGADFQRADYPAGCTVVDNPPFSIVTSIVRWYAAHGVRFFLFCPYLSNLSIARGTPGITHLVAPHSVLYENGAEVPTAFVHNLSPEIAAEADAELRAAIAAADEITRSRAKKELPKYSFPAEVVTSAALGYLAIHGETLRILAADCAQIGALDAMSGEGKSIFGTALLLSTRAAAERAAAERAAAERAAAERAAVRKWQLSDRERAIIAMLDRRSCPHD